MHIRLSFYVLIKSKINKHVTIKKLNMKKTDLFLRFCRKGSMEISSIRTKSPKPTFVCKAIFAHNFFYHNYSWKIIFHLYKTAFLKSHTGVYSFLYCDIFEILLSIRKTPHLAYCKNLVGWGSLQRVQVGRTEKNPSKVN